MEKIYIFGHKNADTDSVCSAIAYTWVLKRNGLNVEAYRLGKLNKETKFVLEKFGVEEPELLEDVEGKTCILLDHNEFKQSANNIEKAEILEIIDHHKMNFSWHKPIAILVRPVGSTCTIIGEIFLSELTDEDLKDEEVKKIAGLLLAGILSDTLVFKSSTTTGIDINIADILSQIADIEDFENFGEEMLKKKSDISDIKTRDMILGDSKEFEFNGKKVLIGQLEVLDDSQALERENEIFEELKKIKQEKGLHSCVFVLTNVLKEGSYMFVVTDDISLFEKAFDKKSENGKAFLEGIMSRKKDIVPKLEKAF